MLRLLRNRPLDLLFLAMATGAFVLAAWYVPTADGIVLPKGESVGTSCWFRYLTGVQCAFCGMTRSFVHLAHGEVTAAFQWHPAGPLLAAWAVAMGLWIVLAAVSRSPAVANRARAVTSLTVVVWICILGGLARAALLHF